VKEGWASTGNCWCSGWISTGNC